MLYCCFFLEYSNLFLFLFSLLLILTFFSSSDPALLSVFAFLQWTPNFYFLDFFLSLSLFLFTGGTTRETVNAVLSPNFSASIPIRLIRVREIPV